MNACKRIHTYIVRLFSDRGADYNKCDRNGLSPVTVVCKRGHTCKVRMLSDRGADCYKCTEDDESSVMIA